MRKFTVLLALLVFASLQVVLAQKTITGTITSSEDGKPIPGATVVVKNTTIGTTTNVDGFYELSVPDDATTLVFSYVGMISRELPIGDATVINTVLELDVMDLEGVVVTALGITREKKALGYSVQDVDGADLNKARPLDAINALSGRVSGVEITNSSGNMGGSARILIRGASSVTGENQPLFIVDGTPLNNANYTDADTERGAGGYDYGNMAVDINPNDIESMSVLKGPAASALYGSRAANGVILITTKKGKVGAGKKGIGVSFNTGLTFEQVSILPEYQNKYGGGYGFDTLWFSEHPEGFPNRTSGYYSGTGSHAGDSYDLMPQYAVDESWGPALEGQMVRPWYSWESQIPEYYGVNVPWEPQPDNVKDFFKTGQTWTTNIALTGGNEKAYFRLGYTNQQIKGVMVNSELDKNTLNFNGNFELNDKLSAFAHVNYIRTDATGRPRTGYDGDNVMQQFNQWSQRQWNNDRMEDYWVNPDGTSNTWNRTAWNNPFPKYTDNPYWTRNMNYETDNRDRLFGNVGFNYKFTDYLSLRATYHKDLYVDRREERIAVGGSNISSYLEAVRQFSETNAEFLFLFNKQLSDDFSLAANFGGNQRTNEYFRNEGSTSGGLPIPEFYSLANTTDPVQLIDLNEKYRVNSLFGSASVGYMSMLYLDVTLRNDWSSTLPEANNSYFYPSVTGSFVFSELGALSDLSWFSFGKVRLGWAQVGNDTRPYRIYPTYRAKENFGSNPLYTVPNAQNNSTLLPEETKSWEVGADIRFFNNRLGVDVTYYEMLTSNQIFPVTVSASTGMNSMIINAGEMSNKGIELLLTGTVIKSSDFSWDITVNWAKNNNELVSLEEGIDNLRLMNGPFSVSVNAFVGEPYGTILGRDYTYENGEKLVGANGMYVRSDEIVPLGSVMPDWTGGIGNTFSYKNFDLSFLFAFRQGGSVFFTSYMWGMYSGMLEATVENDIRTEGIVLEGVMEDPENPDSFITNTTNLGAETYGLNHYYVNAMNVFDGDFIKLRELTLTYSLPQSVIEGSVFQNVSISLIGRNLWTFGTAIKGFDPEHATSAGNIQGIEGGQIPSLRSYGFNVSLNF